MACTQCIQLSPSSLPSGYEASEKRVREVLLTEPYRGKREDKERSGGEKPHFRSRPRVTPEKS